MNLKKLAATASLAVAGVIAAAPASAVVINSASDDFIVDWTRNISGGVTVRGSAAFDITYVSDSRIDLTVSLNNLADLGAPAGWKGGWSTIGWSSSPDIFSGSFTDTGAYFNAGALDNIPSLNAVEICIYSANNCNGGSQNALLPDGGVDSFSLSLYSWPDWSGLWAFDNFGVKFQTDAGSYEWYGSVRTSTPPPPTSVPEPATLGLLGLGLLGLGLVRRRRRM